MILTYKILTGIAGATATGSASLIGTRVLKVKREGLGFNQVLSSPGARQYVFTQHFGALLFFEPFAAGGEKVYVLYKT